MAFRLTITEGRDRGAEFEFDAPEVTFGRGSDNDIVVNDTGVSREHARIRREGEAWKLRDLGSSKGTRLNGRKVEEAVLADGDVIAVGPVSFRFSAGDGEQLTVPLPVPEETPPANPVPSEVPTRPLDKPKAGDGPTRVTERPAPPREAPTRVTAAPAAPAAAVSGASSPPPGLAALLGRPPVLWAAGVVAVAALGAVTWRVLDRRSREADCPDSFELQAEALELRIGSGPVDVECGAQATFVFTHSAGTRAVLHYVPLGVDSPGEVVVRLNGREVGRAPVAPRRGPAQRMPLDPPALKENAKNVVEFVNTKGDTWAVEGVRAELRGVAAADPDRARERYDLGVRKYRERRVAGRNLYDAWKYLLEARQYMEAMEPKPAIWASAEQMVADIEKEMEQRCRALLFTGLRHESYNDWRRANDAYKEILASYPGDDPSGCRHKAEERVLVEEAPDQKGKP